MTEKNNLYELIESIEHTLLAGPELQNIFFDEIITDSRDVGKNDLFIALLGDNQDGHTYVGAVLQSGCKAILVEENRFNKTSLSQSKIPVISVPNTRAALADIASRIFSFPEEEVILVGITGTNGKTTVSYLLENALAHQGERVGVIGTVNYRYTDSTGNVRSYPAPFTTPDPLTLTKLLRKMADAGVSTVLMEVSSHALVQQRLGNILFDYAAFTNLSHDHLDYHHSLVNYFHAKTLLFTSYLKERGKVVITHQSSNNTGLDKWASKISDLLDEQKIEYISCGNCFSCSIRPQHIGVDIDKTEVTLETPGGQLSFISPLVGRYNVDNMMTTLGIAEIMGYDIRQVSQSLAQTAGAPGRLERVIIKSSKSPKAATFIDYAHTPDALLNVLQTLKALPHRRLVCVCGCGGDRDTDKRPKMGKIAAELADVAIITDDNPRSEEANKILNDIIAGIHQVDTKERSVGWLMDSSEDKGYVVIPDRKEAIHYAVKSSAAEDIIVVAGKGHEKYQLTNQGKRFFDDSLEVREALLSWDIESIAAALKTNPGDFRECRYITDVCTDTRILKKGQIFIALHGDNYDGNKYVEDAVLAGAGAIVAANSEKIGETDNVPIFKVPDTLKALGKMAAYRRREIGSISAPTVVGITGSCGKTTVKEMTAAVLEQQWPNSSENPPNRVLKTTGNFNNLVGLPLSLLPLQLKHEAAILEMGMNQPGEIAQLAEIADPDISCIVNVHGAHLEGLGTLDGVARAKEELFAGTHTRGTLVVNQDDARIVKAAEKYPHKKIHFTLKPSQAGKADLWASDIRNVEDGNIEFTLNIDKSANPVKLKVPGHHNVENCLAAAAIAHAVGIKPDIIVKGLESFEAADKRLQVVSAAAGYSIINDTYNANPASMSAGLTTLKAMNGSIKIAILGDMLELGDDSQIAHNELGKLAAQTGLAFLLVVGSFAEHIAQGAASAGMARDTVLVFDSKDDIVSWIKKMEGRNKLPKDMWMLVKGSRGMRLESVVEELTIK